MGPCRAGAAMGAMGAMGAMSHCAGCMEGTKACAVADMAIGTWSIPAICAGGTQGSFASCTAYRAGAALPVEALAPLVAGCERPARSSEGLPLIKQPKGCPTDRPCLEENACLP
eukprot:Skav220931  [mRNA]  locus=scaffold3184:153206:163594:- [translate_table: standard]